MKSVSKREVDRLGPWFHNLHLPDGTQTRPDHELGDFPTFKWEVVGAELPERLDGWTALDIGCNAGFYSFELARRGARVTAVDVDEHYLEQARWASKQFGLQDRIEFRKMQVYELSHAGRSWDLVLFLGVFYHLRYPVLGLDIVSRCVGKRLVFQSMTMPETMPETDGAAAPIQKKEPTVDDRSRLAAADWPKMAFIEERLSGDRTNWWAPNQACVEALLRSAGMRVLSHPEREIYVCEPDVTAPSSMWSWNAAEYEAATAS